MHGILQFTAFSTYTTHHGLYLNSDIYTKTLRIYGWLSIQHRGYKPKNGVSPWILEVLEYVHASAQAPQNRNYSGAYRTFSAYFYTEACV